MKKLSSRHSKSPEPVLKVRLAENSPQQPDLRNAVKEASVQSFGRLENTSPRKARGSVNLLPFLEEKTLNAGQMGLSKNGHTMSGRSSILDSSQGRVLFETAMQASEIFRMQIQHPKQDEVIELPAEQTPGQLVRFKSGSSQVSQFGSRMRHRANTLTLMKPNIDHKIRQLKKYAKWMVLMKLPEVCSLLHRYSRFDFIVNQIKNKIKRGFLTMPKPIIMVEKPQALFGSLGVLRQTPPEYKTTPYKVQVAGSKQIDLEGVAKLTFEQYCKFLMFDHSQMFNNLPSSMQTLMTKLVKLSIQENEILVPYCFFTPADVLTEAGYPIPEETNHLEIRDAGTDLNPRKSRNLVIVVFLDSMSCMSKFVEGLLLSLVRKGATGSASSRGLMHSKYLVANLPGQPYTIFNAKKPFNNLQVATIYDRLLHTCFNHTKINMEDCSLVFVGFGRGSANAVSLCCLMNSPSIPVTVESQNPTDEGPDEPLLGLITFNGIFCATEKTFQTTMQLITSLQGSQVSVHKEMVHIANGLKQGAAKENTPNISIDYDRLSRIYSLSNSLEFHDYTACLKHIKVGYF